MNKFGFPSCSLRFSSQDLGPIKRVPMVIKCTINRQTVDLTVPSVESASHWHKKEALKKGFGPVLAAMVVVPAEDDDGAPSP